MGVKGRARSKDIPLDPMRLERVRNKLQISKREMSWLFCVDPSAYSRWMREATVRFQALRLWCELVERALNNGVSVEHVQLLMGIPKDRAGQLLRRGNEDRDDEQRRRAWAFLASRAYGAEELLQQPMKFRASDWEDVDHGTA